MQQRSVGSTGLKVSRLGLGTMTWGRDTDEHEAREQLLSFVEAGGTLVDTAAGYADGDSESLIGRLLGDVVPRDELVIATKAGISRRTGERVTDASRGHLLRTLDASLARLGVDAVDLWQVHIWSDETPGRGDAVRAGPGRLVRPRGVRRHLELHRLADGAGRDLAARRARAGSRSPRRRSSTPCSTAASSARCCPRARPSGWACSRGRRSAGAC